MVKTASDVFYGKIILFGEYGIIYDSMALTIPFSHFHGELSFDNKYNKYKYTDYDFANNSNVQLEAYSGYLNKIIAEGELEIKFDFDSFVKDLDNGLYFESSIPQGFGLGSSGALVAALYEQYAQDKIVGNRSTTQEDTLKLKNIFSTMESFFHGKSSGIDPLNSYIKFPLLIKSKEDIRTVGIPRNKFNNDSAIFLLNTGNPGKTEPMVNLFLEKCEQPNYFHIITNEYIPLNNACINNLVNGELEEFFKNLAKLSELQIDHFEEMIPDKFKPVWNEGLQSNDFTFKLCGSGGGGYLLGFTPDLTKAQKYFKEKNIDIITVYKSNRG